MDKHYIAMVNADEVESALYYIDDAYRIKPIENLTKVQALEKHDLAVTRDKLSYIIAELKSKRRPYIKDLILEDKIETLETALETIEDVLKLYVRDEKKGGE
jgi:hypothetical protein